MTQETWWFSAWTTIRYVVEWQRTLRGRDGMLDAQRAQTARLLLQQSAPPIGNHLPCDAAHSPLKQASEFSHTSHLG